MGEVQFVGISLEEAKQAIRDLYEERDKIKKELGDSSKKVTAYRKYLWLLARKEGLSLSIPKADLETIPAEAELLEWYEPLFDAIMFKGICKSIAQPDLATPVHSADPENWFADLALKIAKAIQDEFSVGHGSSFCDEADWDPATDKELVEIIVKVLTSNK